MSTLPTPHQSPTSTLANTPTPTPENQTVFYSPDKSRKVEIVQSGTQYVLRENTTDSKPYDKIKDVRFSTSGKTVAFKGTKGEKTTVYINGTETTWYDRVGKDPKYVNCYGNDDVTGIEINDYGYAITGWKNDKMLVNHNGTEGAPFECLVHVTLSPDGQHVIYRAYDSKLLNSDVTREYVLVDARKFGPYWKDCAPGSFPCHFPTFSKDSKRYFFIGNTGPYEQPYIEDQKVLGKIIVGKPFIVVDGNQPYFARIWNPMFSSDSKNIAFRVIGDHFEAVMLNGELQKKYTEVWGHTFSPNSAHLAYKARLNDRSFVILDEKVIKEYSRGTNLGNDKVVIKFLDDNTLDTSTFADLPTPPRPTVSASQYKMILSDLKKAMPGVTWQNGVTEVSDFASDADQKPHKAQKIIGTIINPKIAGAYEDTELLKDKDVLRDWQASLPTGASGPMMTLTTYTQTVDGIPKTLRITIENTDFINSTNPDSVKCPCTNSVTIIQEL